MEFQHDLLDPLPLFLLNTVLFPGGRLPLRVFEARYVDMARDCLKRKRPFGVCLIREGKEVGAPASPETTGCMAAIVECDMQQLGVIQLDTRGGRRFRVLQTSVNSQGLVSGQVEMLDEENEGEEQALPAEFQACAQVLRMIVEQHGEDVFAQPHRFESASWVSYRLSEVLPLSPPGKQKLLELDSSLERLAILQGILAHKRGAR